MNQRLVWNFEWVLAEHVPLTKLRGDQEELKWEMRYFWPNDLPIQLQLIDNSLTHLTNYSLKYKEDDYYLLPDCHYNIKRRTNQLIYKPVLNRTKNAVGYGPKIILASSAEQINPQWQKLSQRVEEEGVGIHVKKEVFTYKVPSTPALKIELARLDLLNKIYFSACIEGKSLYLVETVSRYLLGEQVSCDYVTFLKHILNL